jgi:hypothetical protein
MTFALSKDTRSFFIFEDHIPRYITFYFTQVAYNASKLDYEEKFLILYRRISCSKSTKRRYNNLSSLVKLVCHFMTETKMAVRVRSIARLPGLQEFC